MAIDTALTPQKIKQQTTHLISACIGRRVKPADPHYTGHKKSIVSTLKEKEQMHICYGIVHTLGARGFGLRPDRQNVKNF